MSANSGGPEHHAGGLHQDDEVEEKLNGFRVPGGPYRRVPLKEILRIAMLNRIPIGEILRFAVENNAPLWRYKEKTKAALWEILQSSEEGVGDESEPLPQALAERVRLLLNSCLLTEVNEYFGRYEENRVDTA